MDASENEKSKNASKTNSIIFLFLSNAIKRSVSRFWQLE